ncbi:zinc carboxypeptidase-like [Ostrinia furnacalis]|uniref:zinc carboxypeptidase-like n=1 Tax=Ostrinia furnacalis TaxID=93504 RepID=UPI00103BE96F|nr:zinc carboxypeptidase-like [Ostrinia furnacalis]
MKKIHFFTILLVATVVIAEKKSYDGYKLYKVTPKTEKIVNILEQIRDAGIAEFWSDFINVDSDIRILVDPEKQAVFRGRLIQAGVEVKTIIENVQQVINNQLNPIEVDPSRSSSFLSYDWNAYHNLTDIERWLDEVATTNSSVVTRVTIGQSTENRPIRGIIININRNRRKPVGIIEGTLHAREWISAATVTWIIKEFLTSSDPDVRRMAEETEWHIFPVVNPDGYVYSFTENRMWRKNRNPAYFTSCLAAGVPDDMSRGVDLNRNFNFFWMSTGASSNPCTNNFAGPSAESELETRAIAQYVLGLRQNADIVYYLSFHSYLQWIMLPYSHVNVPSVNNHNHLMEIATNSSVKISERYGTRYEVGILNQLMFPATISGSSFDWAKFHANASISYLFELRDLGEFGFLVPPQQIIPNNLGIMDGLVEMDKATKRLGYFSDASKVVYSLTLVSLAVIFGSLVN